MTKKWFSVAEVAEMLGFGETKVRMAIIHEDLRSVKDGRQRRILPQWVDVLWLSRSRSPIRTWHDEAPQRGGVHPPLPKRLRRPRMDHHTWGSPTTQGRLWEDTGAGSQETARSP
jgi:excisionase family DNA binding protein